MNVERMMKMLLEITNGVKSPARESDADAVLRERLESEVKAIRAKGGVVEILPELP